MTDFPKTSIQTYGGHAFDLAAASPGRVDVAEVAHALSNLNRFTGHTSRPYSVAEHSVRVAARCLALAYELEPKTDNAFARRACLLGLVHDAAEAYTGDISYPMKVALGLLCEHGSEVRLFLEKIESFVEKSLVNPQPSDDAVRKIVKRADAELLAWESNRFLPGGRRGDWAALEGVKERDLSGEIVAPLGASSVTDARMWKDAFLDTYRALQDARPLPFFFTGQYMKRLLRGHDERGVTRWFEPSACGWDGLYDSNGIAVVKTSGLIRVEFQ